MHKTTITEITNHKITISSKEFIRYLFRIYELDPAGLPIYFEIKVVPSTARPGGYPDLVVEWDVTKTQE